jgi:hypothetical protein
MQSIGGETVELGESYVQPVSLKNAIANHIWYKHGSVGDTE